MGKDDKKKPDSAVKPAQPSGGKNPAVAMAQAQKNQNQNQGQTGQPAEQPTPQAKEQIAAGPAAMEAERLSLDDPLMECLAMLAGEFGRRVTAVALAAGLPVPTHGLVTPAVFVRAADRAGLTALSAAIFRFWPVRPIFPVFCC